MRYFLYMVVVSPAHSTMTVIGDSFTMWYQRRNSFQTTSEPATTRNWANAITTTLVCECDPRHVCPFGGVCSIITRTSMLFVAAATL